MIGYDPNKDHLLDPQQSRQSKFMCGGCRRQIYFGEVFYTLIANVSEITICTDCYREIEQSVSTAGEEIYV